MNGSNISWDQRIEAKLLDGNTELRKLAFVSLDHVAVCFSDLFKLGLDALDGFVFNVLYFIKSVTNHTYLVRMNVRCTDDLVNRSFFLIKFFLDRFKFFL